MKKEAAIYNEIHCYISDNPDCTCDELLKLLIELDIMTL